MTSVPLDAAAAGIGDRTSEPASNKPKPARFRMTERRDPSIAIPNYLPLGRPAPAANPIPITYKQLAQQSREKTCARRGREAMQRVWHFQVRQIGRSAAAMLVIALTPI